MASYALAGLLGLVHYTHANTSYLTNSHNTRIPSYRANQRMHLYEAFHI